MGFNLQQKVHSQKVHDVRMTSDRRQNDVRSTSIMTSHRRRCDVMTSHRRRCDVMTSHRRRYDVILTSCARWELRSCRYFQNLTCSAICCCLFNQASNQCTSFCHFSSDVASICAVKHLVASPVYKVFLMILVYHIRSN